MSNSSFQSEAYLKCASDENCLMLSKLIENKQTIFDNKMIKLSSFLFIAFIICGIYVAFKFDTHLTNQDKLIQAVWGKDSEKVKELIKNGTNPNIETSRAIPSFFTRKLIDYLPEKIKDELDVKYINEGWTPLKAAVFSNSYKMTKLLIEEGASPNYLDRHGNSPLFYSMHMCSIEVSRMAEWYLKSHGGIKIECGYVQLEDVFEIEEDPINTD